MSEMSEHEHQVRNDATFAAKTYGKPVVIYAMNNRQSWHALSAQWHAEYVTPDGAWHPLGEQAVPEGSLPVAAAPPCPECAKLRADLQGAAHEQYVYGGQDAKTPSILSDADADFLAGLASRQPRELDIYRLNKMVTVALAAAEARTQAPAPPAPGEVSDTKMALLLSAAQRQQLADAQKRVAELEGQLKATRADFKSYVTEQDIRVAQVEASRDHYRLGMAKQQAKAPTPGLVVAVEGVVREWDGSPSHYSTCATTALRTALAAHRASQQGQTGLTVGAVMAVVDEQLAPMMLTAAIADNLQVVKDKIRGRLTTLFNSEQGQLHKIYCQACKTPRTFDPGDTITAPITCDKCGGALTFGSAASEQVAATSETEVTRSGEHVVVNGDGCGFSGTVDNALATFAIMLQEQSRRAVKPLPTVPRASVTRDGEHVTIIGKGFQFDGTVDNALGNFAAMTHMYCERGERRPAPASSGQVVELFVARSEGDKSDCWLWFNKPAEMLDGCWISSGKLPGASHLPDKYRDLIPPGTCVPCKLVIDGDGDRGIPATPSASCAVYFTGTHPAPTDQQLLERIAEQTAQIIDQTAGDGVKAERESMARAVDAFLDRHKASSLGSIDALIQRQEKELADADSDRLELNKQRAAALAGTCYATLAELRAAHDNCQVFRKATDTHCDIAIAERDTLKLALANARESVDRQATLVHEVEGQRKALADLISDTLRGTEYASLPDLRYGYFGVYNELREANVKISAALEGTIHSTLGSLRHKYDDLAAHVHLWQHDAEAGGEIPDSFCADHGCKTLTEVSAKLRALEPYAALADAKPLSDVTGQLNSVDIYYLDQRGHNMKWTARLSGDVLSAAAHLFAAATTGSLELPPQKPDTAIAKLAPDPLAAAGELGEWVKDPVMPNTWVCRFVDGNGYHACCYIDQSVTWAMRNGPGSAGSFNIANLLALSAAVVRHRLTGDPRKEAGK